MRRLKSLHIALIFIAIPGFSSFAANAADPKGAPTASGSASAPAPKVATTAAAPSTAAAPAQAPKANAPVANASGTVHLDIRKAKLDNGLRVVLAPDHTTPTVAVDVVYDVGSRNEERGRAGFAHLFEHMMFQGSQNVPRNDHGKLVMSHGGTLNGTTSEDRTNYFEMLPSSELPLALWLEADRMKSLDVSQANLDNQRQVVEEEFRMRVLNAAYVPSYIRLSELVFQGYWPYEHPAIGTMPDLDAAQLEWVRSFHDAFYAPNNAVLSISGDVDPDATMELVKKYFSSIKPQPNVPKYDPPKMPEQTSARGTLMEDAHAKLPAVIDAWPIPKSREKDHYALELASMILTDGESSRLHKSLVRERAIAADVSTGTDDHRGPDMFSATAKVSAKGKPDEVDKAMRAEIEKLGKTGPSDAEMQKVKNRLKTKFLMGLQSNIARAQQLAEFELYWGDADLLNTELDKYLAINAHDVAHAVAEYLVPNKITHIDVKPADAPAAAAPAQSAAPATSAAPASALQNQGKK